MQIDHQNSTPVVILAGGYGSRLGELTEKVPKPMIEIGDAPILVHIIRSWYTAGFREFIIAAGYKSNVVSYYFKIFDWKKEFPEADIKVFDTGLETATAGRLLKLSHLLNRRFCVSYGDGLTNYPLEDLLEAHDQLGTLATMMVAHPTSRFGEVELGDDGVVVSFSEKPMSDKWINAGYFVFDPEIFDYIYSEWDVLETDVFPRLVKIWNLYAVRNEEYWHCMDTPKDTKELNKMWELGDKKWER